MSKQSAKLKEHLAQEHKRSPFSDYLKEIVYGGNDGIVTTFAVVAGFTGASVNNSELLGLSFLTVLLFGLANLFADGISMGLGDFLAERSEAHVYESEREKEAHEVKHNEEMETEETVDILVNKGFSMEDATQLVSIYKRNPEYWIDWMMTHELELPHPDASNPALKGLATFLSFLFFGAIPLLPFGLLENGSQYAFLVSAISTLGALTMLGLLKWRVIRRNLVQNVAEIVLVGGLASTVAFVVGSLFG